ncbi:MAG: S41 family peptidase [Chthoniobacterales bacterium]
MLRPALSVSLTILLGVACARAATPSATPVVAAKPTPSPTAIRSAEPLDDLPPADLARALEFIRKNYVGAGTLDAAAVDRATLAGLIDRLGRGVTLAAKSPPAAASAPFARDIIADHIGYLRPGGLRKSDLGALDDALRIFAGKKVDAIILDLRAAEMSSDFALAAEFAQRFVARGAELFAVRGPAPTATRTFTSDRSPSYSGFLCVLIDGETIGAAEVLASVLRARARAILIGEATAGAAVDFSELALADGMVLRVAVTEAVLPEQSGAFPRRVRPDIAVALAPGAKHEIFAQSLSKGMSPFVFEDDRPHLNEAALLAGTNPEIEAMQDRQQRRARGEKPPLHDAVAQRAVDVITSIGVYAKQPGRKP